MFPSGLTNLKRNSGQNHGVGLIPLKSILFSNKPKELLNCNIRQVLEADQNQLVPIAMTEATCIRSIGHRLMIPYTEEGMGEVRINK